MPYFKGLRRDQPVVYQTLANKATVHATAMMGKEIVDGLLPPVRGSEPQVGSASSLHKGHNNKKKRFEANHVNMGWGTVVLDKDQFWVM